MKVLRFFLSSSSNGGHSRWVLLAVLLASLIGGTSNMAILATLNKLLSLSTTPGRLLLIQILAFCLLSAGCRSLAQILLMRYAIQIAVKMRLRLCRQILASPLRNLEKIGFARLLASFTEDVPTVTTALSQLPSFCLNLSLACACIAYMTWLSYDLILPLLVCGTIGLFGYRWIERKARTFFGKAHGFYVRLLANFRALVEGSKELQLHRAKLQDFMKEDIEVTTNMLAKHRFTSSILYALADSWNALFGFVAIGVLIFFYVYKWHPDGHSATATGYVLAFMLLMPTIQSITSALPSLGQAAFALDKIDSLQLDIAKQQATTVVLPADNGLQNSWEKLTAQKITHSYIKEEDNSVFTLGPADLEIGRGELVFITGGNGSGKTTLIKILCGLYLPEEGEIRLDDTPITDANAEEYRQLFSAVFSDFFLFERLLGLSGVEDVAREYLQRFKLDGKVSIEQGRFSTIKLSQGQRKRLALLLAYLENRPIYIFDEWAADQDPVFRDIFYHEILIQLRQKHKTVLVVSHDDRYYYLADRIIRLDYGQVVECRKTTIAEGAMAAGD